MAHKLRMAVPRVVDERGSGMTTSLECRDTAEEEVNRNEVQLHIYMFT